MKKILIPIIFVSFIAVLSSCHKSKEYNQSNTAKVYELGIDFQTTYLNDHVIAEIDGNKVFDQLITTNHVLSFAALIKLNLNAGNHLLKITFNDKVLISENISISAKLYLGIEFDKAAQLAAINSSSIPFVYE